MVPALYVLRTFSLLLYLTFYVHASAIKPPDLFLQSLEVGTLTCDKHTCKYLLNVNGADFLGRYPWRLTPDKGASGGSCEIIYPNYEIKEIETSKSFSKLEVSVPNVDGRIYFCIQEKAMINAPFGGVWVHQGVEHFLEPKNDVVFAQKRELQITADSKPNSTQGQEADTQRSQTLEDHESNMQEVNAEWRDLTHDTDVNYLPSAPRPTRDEKNDIEVLYHEKRVPLKQLIEPLDISTQENFDRSLNQAFNIDIKRNDIKNGFEQTIQDNEEDRTNIKRTANKVSLYNKAESIQSILIPLQSYKSSAEMSLKKLDTIMFIIQSSKIDALKPEIKLILEDEIKKIPNYNPTLQKLAAKCFPNYGCIQIIIATLQPKSKTRSDMSTQEIEQSITNERYEENLISMKDIDDAYGDEFGALLSVLQSREVETKAAEIRDIMDKINARLNDTSFRKVVEKCFPEHGCIKLKMIALPLNANSSKKSLQEMLQDMTNNRMEEEHLTPINDVKFDEKLDKEFHALVSIIIQSSRFRAKIAEMRQMMDKFNYLPTYTTLQKIAEKYFPNDESLQKLMAAPLQSSKSAIFSLKKYDSIMFIIRCSKIDALKPEIKLIIEDEVKEIPNYNPTLQKLAAKCFPNYGCIQIIIAIPHPNSKSRSEMASRDIKQFVKQPVAENLISMNDTFGKEFDALLSILQSNENDTNVAEIRNIIHKIKARPPYTTFRQNVEKCFPDHGCIKLKIIALRLIPKSPPKNSLQAILQGIAKNGNEEKTLTSVNDDKFDDTEDKFVKEFNSLMSVITQSSKFDIKMAEMEQMMDTFNDLPTYTILQKIAAKYFPDDECLHKLMAAPSPNSKFYIEDSLKKLYALLTQTSIIDAKMPKIKLLVDKMNDIPDENNPKILPNLNSKYSEFFLPVTSEQEHVPKIRKRRQVIPEDDFTSVRASTRAIVIEGIRIEDSDKEPKIIEDGIPSVLAESSVTLRVFGEGLTPNTVIAFTHDPQLYGQPCKFLLKGEYMVKEGSLQARTALFDIRTPAPITASKLYICAKNLRPGVTDPNKDEEKYLHQGTETWKMIASHNKILPLWVSISLILFCLMFSALFSGLNLGLMSLDRTELKIIANTGTEQERKYARAIQPVRDHGNYLLCSILLGNVAVNSTFTILLDELTSGLFAVIFSTLAIVLLGEITPQAICSRHGLMVGAKSIMVTKGVMAVTAPLSFPVSKLLDYFLGEEIGNVYNRERLKELVKVTTDVNDLDKEEVNIISGALEMRKKTVSHVMTKLEDVFMLPISSVLDFETMSEIVKSGYSRIPVYEGSRGNIVTVLFIKDLAFVDPDDNTPLRTLCQYYQNPCNFVFEDVTLDVMFKQFKDGHKGHMAFVHRINNEGEGDPFYETIGLVTLEDVIEEMIQSEIVDETDVFLDNRSKRRRRPQNKLQDFAAFAERHENQRIHISPQLTLAAFQFLSTSVDAFRPDMVSETVLRRLLQQDVIQYIKIKGKTKKDPTTYVYQQGKPVDYFVLILEGRVEVTVGRENLVFEAGPFTYFGVQALTQNVGVAESPTPSAMGSLQNINIDAMLRYTFVPDYSVRAITSVYYLTVKRSLYLAAKRATLMEKGNISKGGTTQEFDTEVDKNLCGSSSGNISMSVKSRKQFIKSTSAVFDNEGALTSASDHKALPRVNIIELMQVMQHNPSVEKIDISEKFLKRVSTTLCGTDPEKLLQSVDEDLSITGEHKTPSRQVSPHPLPVSPAQAQRVDSRNGHAHAPASTDEQERLLK